MWTYCQSDGHVLDVTGKLLVVGYSGFGSGRNNPSQQSVHDLGPIPVGIWTFSAPTDTVTHGPYVLALTPEPGTDTFGRSGFLVHGDSREHPGEASHGCIILPRFARERMWESGDHQLQVVSGVEGGSGTGGGMGMVTDFELGT